MELSRVHVTVHVMLYSYILPEAQSMVLFEPQVSRRAPNSQQTALLHFENLPRISSRNFGEAGAGSKGCVLRPAGMRSRFWLQFRDPTVHNRTVFGPPVAKLTPKNRFFVENDAQMEEDGEYAGIGRKHRRTGNETPACNPSKAPQVHRISHEVIKTDDYRIPGRIPGGQSAHPPFRISYPG